MTDETGKHETIQADLPVVPGGVSASSDQSSETALRLEDIPPPQQDPSIVPDHKTLEEEQAHEKAYKDKLLRDMDSLHDLRKEYADKIFCLIKNWCLGVGALLLLEGFGAVDGWFDLPDVALTTLVGATTASVLGILAIVIAFLFPKDHSSAGIVERLSTLAKNKT